jgi:hypothetical protein
MNMTSILTRALLLTVFGVSVSIAMVNRVQTVNAATPVVSHAIAASNTGIVELPTISVKPTAQELADAESDDAAPIVAATRPLRSVNRQQFIRAVTPSLPTLGLDMPYYSFGKALPRVSKE